MSLGIHSYPALELAVPQGIDSKAFDACLVCKHISNNY